MERARSERRARLGIGRLFDNMRDALVVAEVETGLIALWNPSATRLFGWTPEEAEGKPLHIIIPERMRVQHQAGMERFRRTGHGAYIDTNAILQLPGLHKDGHEIELELVLSPLVDGAFVVGTMRDVTDRVRRDSELQAAHERLKQVNEDLEAFAHVVSHDLKEPVRALESYLEALEEDHGHALDKDARDLLERSRAAAARLRDHMQRLLDYSRASRDELLPETLSVASLVQSDSCALMFRPLVEERRARLDVEEDIPPVRANPSALCQVLGNVIANALKHNPARAPNVTVRGVATATEVEILVHDNGPGFPEMVMRTFTEGGFAPGAGPRGGFGLAIARRAVERQAGRMWLENPPEGGALVHIVLPRAH